jgi:hypothetical protein
LVRAKRRAGAKEAAGVVGDEAVLEGEIDEVEQNIVWSSGGKIRGPFESISETNSSYKVS